MSVNSRIQAAFEVLQSWVFLSNRFHVVYCGSLKLLSWPKTNPCCPHYTCNPYNIREINCCQQCSAVYYAQMLPQLASHRQPQLYTNTHTKTRPAYVSKQSRARNQQWPSHSNWLQMKQMKLFLPAVLIYPPVSVKIPTRIVSLRCRCKLGCEWAESGERQREIHREWDRPKQRNREREREMCEQIRLVLGACLWFQWTDVSPGSWGCWQQSWGKRGCWCYLELFCCFYDQESLCFVLTGYTEEEEEDSRSIHLNQLVFSFEPGVLWNAVQCM